MAYWIIELSIRHPDWPMYWCGWEPGRAGQPGTHRWIRGTDGAKSAIRFQRKQDAQHAGVGGPNTPYGRTDTLPDRGVQITQMEEL